MIKNTTISALIALFIFCASCSKDENETPDTTPPSVDFNIKGISNSTQTPVIGNVIEIEIDAQDAKGISKVEAFLNDAKVGEDTQAPFKITIDLSSYSKKLSGKGTVISKTKTQYTLKVSATDIAGNVASVERDIIVDNEMPSITEVSLENNSVIAGEENIITFKANDNKEIATLEVKINDVIVETTTLEDNIYTFNIDSSLLDDGIKNLTIKVVDQATNTAIYNASFVVDNTGPEINLEGLSSDDIIDEVTLLTIGAEDSYSDVTSLKIFINDNLILNSEDGSELSVNFNPDDYDTGDTTFNIVAIDALGNESTLETAFLIKRLLLKIIVPNDFLDPSVSKFYVFASKNSGELLDIKPLEFNTSIIRLNTLEDISPNTDYMINFAYLYSGIGQTSIINTIQNVKRSALDRIDLKAPPQKTISSKNSYQMSSFPSTINIIGEASDYYLNWDPANPANGFTIGEYNIEGINTQSNKYYLYYQNYANGNYGYQLLDKPLSNNFEMDYNDFTSDEIETRHINASSVQDSETYCGLTLYGYLNETDFENDIKHRIVDAGGQNINILGSPGFAYKFNPNFYNYSYKATLENYHIEATGEPLAYYTAPDWSLDYTYSSTNKAFTINATGSTHNVGKIVMDKSGNDSYYTWTVFFNSQTSEEVVLPELPEELKSWNINNYYTSGNLTTEQIEIKKYDGLNTYEGFLQSVIKNTEYKPHAVSDKIESIYISNIGAEAGIEAYIQRHDFVFFRNWY